jgi:RNA polymerase sigma factor (sigma-70 family)
VNEMSTVWLQHQLELAKQGDAEAMNPIIERCLRRMDGIAHRMLGDFPKVRRWEETNDVVQRSVLRLMRALQDVPVNSTRDFFGLAATQIRRELLDLARHYNGPEGLGANFNSGFHGKADDDTPREMQPIDQFSGRNELAGWARLHETVETLEAEEREVFSLVFYHGWTQPQIAELFQVDERTIRRRWRAVCLTLQEKLGADIPGSSGE